MAALSVATPSVAQTLDERFQSPIRFFLRLGQLRMRPIRCRERLHTLMEQFSDSGHLSFRFLLHPVHTGIRLVSAGIRPVSAGFGSRLTFEDELHCVLNIHSVEITIGLCSSAANAMIGIRAIRVIRG